MFLPGLQAQTVAQKLAEQGQARKQQLQLRQQKQAQEEARRLEMLRLLMQEDQQRQGGGMFGQLWR